MALFFFLTHFRKNFRFLEEVAKHETVILIGETGCGKTTQIPQYIHEARLEAPRAIAITQPRRMAAISIAKRVAQEMRVSIGSLVGYKVRFEDCTDTVSRLIYLTDGMLLREAMLGKYKLKSLDFFQKY